jgi:REP-associated tyrosine transposase
VAQRTYSGHSLDQRARAEYIIWETPLVEDVGAAPFDFKGAGFSSMRNPLRRYYGRGDLHFVTFSCYRRLPFLRARRARDVFVRMLEQVRSRHQFLLIGYVVMPEHVHLLLSEPKKSTPSKVLQVLKQKVSRVLRGKGKKSPPGQLSLPFSGTAADAGAFWQRRFYDFNVYSSGKLNEKLDHMHANPVARKLVAHPKDWPWSSWSHYAKGEAGLIRIHSLEGERRGGLRNKDRVGRIEKSHP